MNVIGFVAALAFIYLVGFTSGELRYTPMGDNQEETTISWTPAFTIFKKETK